MKAKYLMFALIFSCASLFSFAASNTDTIKVSGNCAMCKSHIETAAKNAGATSALWYKNTKLLAVSFDPAKTSNMAIQKKIAAAGYDTQDVKATEASYSNLDKCCQYKRTTASAESCCKDMKSCTKDGCCKSDMSCCSKDKTANADCCKDGKCQGTH